MAVYSAEVVDNSKSWLTKVEREQVKIGRFVLGTSQSAAVDGVRGILGMEMVSARIDKLFLTCGRRFEWLGGNWVEAVG